MTAPYTKTTTAFVAELKAHGLTAALTTYDGGHVFGDMPAASAAVYVGRQEAWLAQAMAAMGGSSGGAVANVAIAEPPRLMLAHAR